MAKHQADERQYALDFTSDRNEARARVIRAARTYTGTLGRKSTNYHLRGFVLYVFNLSTRRGMSAGSVVQQRIEELCEEFELGRTAMIAVIEAAVASGIVRKWSDGKNTNGYEIDFEAVTHWTNPESATRTLESARRTLRVRVADSQSSRDGPSESATRTPYKELLSEPFCLPPPPSAVVVAEKWDEVARDRVRTELRRCGYQRSDGLAREAEGLGLDPQSVVDVCVEFRANRRLFRDAGAIADRVRSGVWPAGGVRTIDKIRSDQQAAAAAAQHKADEERAQQQAKERDAAQEARWGPVLDAMPAAEVDALVERAVPRNAHFFYRRDGRKNPTVRPFLIDALASGEVATVEPKT